MGANDPSSGTAALHEVIRGLGALLKSGWKPLRSILIASWDAEEVCYSTLFGTLPNGLPSLVLLAAQNGERTFQDLSTNMLLLISISVIIKSIIFSHGLRRGPVFTRFCIYGIAFWRLGVSIARSSRPRHCTGDPTPNERRQESLGRKTR